MANEISEKRRGSITSPVTLIRIGSIIFLLVTIGHLSAYPWTSDQVIQEKQLASSMKSVDLVFFGQHSSYWHLYFGWGLYVACLLLVSAIILWLLSGIVRYAPRPVGVMIGVFSVSGFAGAYLSFLFFYTPPFIMMVVVGVVLMIATVQLLRSTNSTSGS